MMTTPISLTYASIGILTNSRYALSIIEGGTNVCIKNFMATLLK